MAEQAQLPSLDAQIEELGRQVSAFRDERDRLLSMVEDSRPHPVDVSNTRAPSPPPEHVDAATQTVPIAPPPSPPPPPEDNEDDSVRPPDAQFLDMNDDEMSMELATPLMPSIVTLRSLDLSPRSGSEDVPSMTDDNGSDSYVDPPSIPLPPSPPLLPP